MENNDKQVGDCLNEAVSVITRINECKNWIQFCNEQIAALQTKVSGNIDVMGKYDSGTANDVERIIFAEKNNSNKYSNHDIDNFKAIIQTKESELKECDDILVRLAEVYEKLTGTSLLEVCGYQKQ